MTTIAKHGLNAYKRHKCRCEVCLDAHRESRIRERLKMRRTVITHRLIDATPLIALYKERDPDRIDKLKKRWEESGISIYEADEFCMRLGFHPIEVFGSAYFEGLCDEEEEYRKIYGELADV